MCIRDSYYGRIKAIQLEYTEALDYLVKSLRKAPSSAIGFRQTVEKLRVTVELLLGNIPERQLFLQQANKEALAPYFELTKGNHIFSFICLSFIFSPERPTILKNKIQIFSSPFDENAVLLRKNEVNKIFKKQGYKLLCKNIAYFSRPF